jgi:hypothetical protein
MDQIEFTNVAYSAYGGAWLGPLALELGLTEEEIRRLATGDARITRMVSNGVVSAASVVIARRALIGFDQSVELSGKLGKTVRLRWGADKTGRLSSKLIAKGLRKRGYRIEFFDEVF